MGIISSIIIGFIVGMVARFLMPGKDPAGFIVTTLLGVIGAAVGGFLGRVLGLYQPDEPAGFIMSVIGALVVLFVYNKMRREHRHAPT